MPVLPDAPPPKPSNESGSSVENRMVDLSNLMAQPTDEFGQKIAEMLLKLTQQRARRNQQPPFSDPEKELVFRPADTLIATPLDFESQEDRIRKMEEAQNDYLLNKESFSVGELVQGNPALDTSSHQWPAIVLKVLEEPIRRQGNYDWQLGEKINEPGQAEVYDLIIGVWDTASQKLLRYFASSATLENHEPQAGEPQF